MILVSASSSFSFFFFFNDTATTEIYTLSLHGALPICRGPPGALGCEGDSQFRAGAARRPCRRRGEIGEHGDRKSTRLNSSHLVISYAVFCLKKKKIHQRISIADAFRRHYGKRIARPYV